MIGRRRRRRRFGIALAALLLPILHGPAASAEAFDPETTCAVPEDLATTELPLAHVRAKLKVPEVVRIVVVGSGSSAGMGASTQVNAYPALLAGELTKVFPNAKFEVTNLSKRGRSASDMEALFGTAVAALHPALVIWQTGTVDAVKGLDLAGFEQVLEVGIDKLRALGADVILMNMQYSPHTTAALDITPYRDYMRWAIQSRTAILFHRYSMMKYWVEAGVLDFSSPSKADQAKNDDLAHSCLAYRLAREIESAVKAAEAESTQ